MTPLKLKEVPHLQGIWDFRYNFYLSHSGKLKLLLVSSNMHNVCNLCSLWQKYAKNLKTAYYMQNMQYMLYASIPNFSNKTINLIYGPHF